MIKYDSFEGLFRELHSSTYFLHVFKAASSAIDFMSYLEVFDGGVVVFHMPFDIASVDEQIRIFALEVLFLSGWGGTASL
jgi:hypothetical protein